MENKAFTNNKKVFIKKEEITDKENNPEKKASHKFFI